MQGFEAVEEEPAEETRQHAHRQKEAGLAGDPARSIRRQPAAGNDDVDVRMVGQRRAPGVQDGGEADAPAQMLRIIGDGGECLRGGPEQEVVDGGLVVAGDGADRSRQGEDDVVIGNRQKLGLAVFEPLPRRGGLALRAMPVAAGNGRRPLPALWAKFVMGSQQASILVSTPFRGILAPHYVLSLSIAISLSGGRKDPFLRCGGTMASMASSLSVGSPWI